LFSAGLAGVTDAQAGRVDGGPQIRDLPALLAARRDRRLGLAGQAAAQRAQLAGRSRPRSARRS
jgi:hypothetical protein